MTWDEKIRIIIIINMISYKVLVVLFLEIMCTIFICVQKVYYIYI